MSAAKSLSDLLAGIEPPSSLDALLRQTGGADLRSVAKAVSGADTPWAARILDELVASPNGAIAQGEGLPLPHPCDAEFRFDERTVQLLADALLRDSSPGDEILLVGAPTLAIELAKRSVDRRVRFVGPADCVSFAVRAAFIDREGFVMGLGPQATANVALVDPPWYDDPVEAMISIVGQGLLQNGRAIFVGPGRGARPQADRDFTRYLHFCRSIGLEQVDSTAIDIGYRTPLFEVAALETQGIRPPDTWRYGTSVVLRQIGGKEKARSCIASPDIPEELVFQGVRIRLLADCDRSIQSSAPDTASVFPSVSRRASGRSQPNLWTTSNRVASVDAFATRKAFEEIRGLPAGILRKLVHAADIGDFGGAGVAFSEESTQGVIRLLATELREAARLVGEGSWATDTAEWRSRAR